MGNFDNICMFLHGYELFQTGSCSNELVADRHGGCGYSWVGGCGWFWVAADGFKWFLVVLDGFGWFVVLVVTLNFFLFYSHFFPLSILFQGI